MTDKQIREDLQIQKATLKSLSEKIDQAWVELGIKEKPEPKELSRILEFFEGFPNKDLQAQAKHLRKLLSDYEALAEYITKLELSIEDGDYEPKPRPLLVIKKPLNILAQAVDRGEPVFVVRAQDKKAILTLQYYRELLWGNLPPEARPTALMDSMTHLIDEFKAWQEANSSLVKDPD